MGVFITFEGCEGSGKSTQLQLLKDYLTKLGVDFIFAREPGGTVISEKIRSIILDKSHAEMSDECEALLYASARAQLLNEVIIPALNAGKMVILDRYVDSSLAYQAYARGLGFDFVAKINDFALNNFPPNLTLFLDISPEDAFKRKGGVDEGDRLEIQGLNFHTKVYEGYLSLAEKFPSRFVKVDCHGEKLQTHEKIINILKEKGYLR